jgi:hypothetical protein
MVYIPELLCQTERRPFQASTGNWTMAPPYRRFPEARPRRREDIMVLWNTYVPLIPRDINMT